MATREIVSTNQICKIQNAKKCLSLMDKLKMVDPRHYAQIHAQGETVNGMKQSSLIQVVLQDYTNGTGANNVRVTFNLAPEQVQFFLTRIEAGFQEFEWESSKIFGEPDQSGYSIAQSFSIKRSPVNANGEAQRYPWNIYIANGSGIRVQNANGGYYMKSQSFVKRASAFIQASDMDLYVMLKRADSYIQNWERLAAASVIPKGLKMYDEALKAAQASYTQNQYGQAQYGQYDQQQYAGQYDQQYAADYSQAYQPSSGYNG